MLISLMFGNGNSNKSGNVRKKGVKFESAFLIYLHAINKM